MRDGLQSIFVALSVGLALVALFSYKKLAVVGGILVVWLLAAGIAYTPESGLQSIGAAVGRIVTSIVETISP